MNRTDYFIQSLEDYSALIEQVKQTAPVGTIVLLIGDLGSGKTTFVKEFLETIQSDINVSSPTFSLIQEYPTDPKIFHLDLYRLKHAEEALEIGVEELLHHRKSWIFIEWPDVVMNLLPAERIELHFIIDSNEKGKRRRVILKDFIS